MQKILSFKPMSCLLTTCQIDTEYISQTNQDLKKLSKFKRIFIAQNLERIL